MKRIDSNDDCLISVIIPCYNSDKYIGNALDSVLGQGVESIEIICVDDNSDDNTSEIIESYSKKDNRIINLKNDKNMGAGYCRNFGLKSAKGTYVHFLDSDDWLEKGAYKTLVKNMYDDVDFCMFCYTKYDNESGEISCAKLFGNNIKSELTFEEDFNFLLNTSVVPWNKFYRRSFLVNNDLSFDEISCANDRTFYFTSIVNSKCIKVLDESLIYYRVNNPDSLVGSGRKNGFKNHILAFYSSINKIEKKLNNDQMIKFLQSEIRDLFLFYNKLDYSIELNNVLLEFFRENIKLFDSFDDNFFDFSYGPQLKVMIDNSLCDNLREKTVPIVFATNNNYAPYLGIAIQSLIEKKDNEFIYKIYILHSGICKRYIDLISKLKTDCCDISFLNVSMIMEQHSGIVYSRAHYSVEMYYRMLVPEIFKPYRKVLYLDCDIVVNNDISALFNTDIGENYIGAIPNVSSNEMSRYISNQLKLQPENYVNSGVLLLNLIKLNSDKISDRFFKCIGEHPNLVCPDQDVINMICENNIAYLPLKWNFQWYYSILNSDVRKGYPLNTDMKNQYKEAEMDPYIIHYTSGIKAWNNPDKMYSAFFWEIALRSSFFMEIVTKNLNRVIDNAVNANIRSEKEELQAKLEWNREERKRLENSNKVLLDIIKAEKYTEPSENPVKDNNDYKNQVEEIRKSFSYKVGLFITWIPRKIRSLFSQKR